MDGGHLGIAIIIAALLGLIVFVLVDKYQSITKPIVVTCPANGESAAIKVRAAHEDEPATQAHPFLLVKQCSRWPERHPCSQACLHQLAQARIEHRPRDKEVAEVG